ncbi:hypothetical protein SELR_17910 [Selenomonas ruminantium subsp. lactilytica TAM6421]|uniref:DUF3846 domain-containing protein n=1 Tax=Selenomonas ruminantium subsp. lactilytica (strain NBRC 103574 / TAM6421) TaxID=927704 RepID=I0GRW2_SELRL|nr:hypothetical protein [Selenomonas ruminantium]BAL83499.1 hypothetical protein SELR_17910 [Selenomonas ruminantium subsp. lactilytica TAM6421]
MNVLVQDVSVLNDGKYFAVTKVCEIDAGNTLQAMYDLIGCDTVDYRSFTIEGHEYDAWFDDEFLFADKQIPSALLTEDEGWGSNVLICNNVFYARSDMEGGMVGLTDEDVERLKRWQSKSMSKAIKYARVVGMIG